MTTLTVKFTFVSGDQAAIIEPDLQTLIATWAVYRDRQGFGASEIESGGDIHDEEGRFVGHLSYNGRVWAGREWKPGDVPLYDPYQKGPA